MNEQMVVEMYVRLIRAGKRSISQIPLSEIRKKVEEKLQEQL